MTGSDVRPLSPKDRWATLARWLIGAAVVVVAAVHTIQGVATVKYFGDENDWVARTYFARLAFVDRDFSHPRWGELDGVDHPHIAEFFIAAALTLDGSPPGPVPAKNFSWMNSSDEPEGRRLLVARIPSAALGVLTALLVYLIGLAATGRVLVAAAAGLSYACHPLAVESTCRAMSDGPLMFFSCAAIYFTILAFPVRPPTGEQRYRRSAFLALAAISVGLAVGAKLTGLMILISFVCVLGLKLIASLVRHGLREWRSQLCNMLAVPLVAGAIVAFNPTLYRDPVGRMEAMVRHRLKTARIQQDHWAAHRLDTVPARYSAAGGLLLWNYPPFQDSSWPAMRLWIAPVGLLVVLHAVLWRPAYRWRLVTLAAWFAAEFLILIPTQPMDWARYFLPAVPVFELVSAIGLAAVVDEAVAWGRTVFPNWSPGRKA